MLKTMTTFTLRACPHRTQCERSFSCQCHFFQSIDCLNAPLRQVISRTPVVYCIHVHSLLVTRRRSFAEYWKYFVARFNDVHAFGYNSAGSERIWMKFGELRVYCLELALTDFGRDPRRSESRRP